MISTSNLHYSNGCINSGAIIVDAQYKGKILQVRFKDSKSWSDVGKVSPYGTTGFKRAFRIGSPQYVEVRIFNGPILGEVYLG